MFFLYIRHHASSGGGGGGGGSTYTYYIDPNAGNDSNPGSFGAPWQTTTNADGMTLSLGITIAYRVNGSYYLYRKLNMTAAEAQLAANLVTATADEF
jgi:hypothetical protein